MKQFLQNTPKMVLSLFAMLFLVIHSTRAQRNPRIGAGNSYVNISKGNNGGVVEPGDTLEIRTTYFFNSTYIPAPRTLFSMRYYDSVPTRTQMLTGTADSLRLITNEGVTTRKYTLATNDDPGNFILNPGAGRYQIRINIGQFPTIPNTANSGVLANTTGSHNIVIGTYRPSIFGGTLITTAFRVRVTGSIGDTIRLAQGRLVFKKITGGPDTVMTAIPYKILISDDLSTGICSNGLGPNLASELGGTFGSGNTQNRAAGPIFPIPSYDYRILTRASSIGDGNYSFVNNLSPTHNINPLARMRPNCLLPAGPIPINDSCVHRMHGGFWDIIGDHTGTSNAIGNPAVPSGVNGGYMLVVNSDVLTSEAYRQSIVSGLCENTYYEFSAWVRNICKRCGIDSASVQRFNPGVLPNLAFSVNDIDRYTTGQLDTVGWQRKGFIFKTGLGQTSAVISIRNNAPGGGGNDWAMDDIQVSHCGPTLSMNFSPVFLTCREGPGTVVLSDTVRYLFDASYIYFKWQRSNVGGTIWSDIFGPGTSGIGSPILINGQYQYHTTLPPIPITYADSGVFYRVIVATSPANLVSADCNFTDGTTTMINVVTCGIVLQSEFLQFKGFLTGSAGTLFWNTKGEVNLQQYEIERSTDGSRYQKIGFVHARNLAEASYNFTDPNVVSGKVFYRLKMLSNDQKFKYSQVIVLSNNLEFEVGMVENPFKNSIKTNIIVPAGGPLLLQLFDARGVMVKKLIVEGKKGINHISLDQLFSLQNGFYILQATFNNETRKIKLVKVN